MGYVESLLATNEEVVIQSRQHWRVIAGALLTHGFLFVFLVALAVLFGFFPIIPRYSIGSTLALVLLAVSILPILAFLRDLLEWWNQEYIVTNRRVIQAQGILGKHVLDSSLDKINDVKLTQSFLGRMFDYGDLEIDTANVSDPNVFRSIAAPVKFKMALMNQKEQMSGGRIAAPSPHVGGESEAAMLLQELDELHKQGVLTTQEYLQKKSQLLARMKIN
jgi:hypothetical protein